MVGNKHSNPSEEDVWNYIKYHTNEDWPMDQTLQDFNDKVVEFKEILDKYNEEVA